jgi:hypothetical protein
MGTLIGRRKVVTIKRGLCGPRPVGLIPWPVAQIPLTTISNDKANGVKSVDSTIKPHNINSACERLRAYARGQRQ